MIIYQARNPYARIALLVLPLIVFAVMWFTVFKSSNDQANAIIKSTNQQVQQQLDQARKHAPASAQGAYDEAAKAMDCVEKAGTDVDAAMACAAPYGG